MVHDQTDVTGPVGNISDIEAVTSVAECVSTVTVAGTATLSAAMPGGRAASAARDAAKAGVAHACKSVAVGDGADGSIDATADSRSLHASGPVTAATVPVVAGGTVVDDGTLVTAVVVGVAGRVIAGAGAVR